MTGSIGEGVVTGEGVIRRARGNPFAVEGGEDEKCRVVIGVGSLKFRVIGLQGRHVLVSGWRDYKAG